MPITDLALRNAKPREREYKIFDAHGLYLRVRPNGARTWVMAYRVGGKQKKLHIGPYPLVGLVEARNARERARKLLLDQLDPGQQKRLGLLSVAGANTVDSFRVVAEEFRAKEAAAGAAPATLKKTDWLLTFINAEVGDRRIGLITAQEMLGVLRLIEAKGLFESAGRARSLCSRIFRYAIATGRAERDVCADLRGALTPPQVTHRAALLDPKEVGKLMRAIYGYNGNGAVWAALKIVPLTFVRSLELRHALWSEVDLDGATWRIPAERMKMKRDHIVPLSRQAVAVLRNLKGAGYRSKFLFPSVLSGDRPISENTINTSLRRMGYTKTEMTGHGFRRMASTLLNENGFEADWIERQLAHVESNKVRAAYNAAEYLPQRTAMMQWWADYLDRLAFDEDDLIG